MYKISDKNVKGLFDAIAAEDNELVAAYIKDIYVEIFDNTQALDGDELDTFTAHVDVSSDEGTDGINAELDKLYDFCDAHGISLEADSKVAVKEAIDDSTFDKLLDKAFEFGYNYGYSDTFEDFMKRVKPNVKQSLTKDMLIRLEDAFDNGKHEGDVDETAPDDYKESLNKVNKNSLNESSDGWSEELAERNIIHDLESYIYELRRTVRGAYTGAHTYQELANYTYDLADRLEAFGDEISDMPEDDDEMDEALNERELSTKERSISKIFVDNRDKINKAGTKEELISVVKDLLKDVNPERTRKIFAALDSKKDYFRALQYIYDFILKGDDLGVIKEETIDLPDADKMVKDAEKEADKILADLKLEEDCFDCCEDDFGYADDDTKELFSDDDKGEFDDELGFVPDDVMSIDMVADDDGVRETIKPQEVTHVNECTPPQFKPAKPVNMECVDKTPRRIDDIDITMDDDFEPDDVSDIVIGD